MATEKHNTSVDLSVFFPDVLKKLWKEDKKRPWDTYSKEESFRYFWDRRETPK